MDRQLYMIGRDAVPEKITLDRPSELAITLLALPGVSAGVSLTVEMTAPGSKVDIAGLYLCQGSEKLEIDITVRHLCEGCESVQHLRGLAGGESRVTFNGLIYVAHGACKTKAEQLSHGILLSDKALVTATPGLEIYNDDVECSHGCTVGFPDEDELFYMRSRGIPEQVARKLQKIAFISPITSRLSEDEAALVYESLD